MSNEDQNATIVRLMRELSEAKRELALAREALRSNSGKWSRFAQALAKAVDGDTMEAQMAAHELIQSGHLAQANTLVGDLERLPRRIGEINATLKAAGIELS